MPRISAASVAEHVAQQEAAVADAAVRLFLARGYANVTLADVAAEVGLARSSLYRYVPDKAHLLVAWAERELPAQVERASELLAGGGPPLERVLAWVDHQLAYARRPEHALVAALAEVVPELDDETRRRLGESHAALARPLVAALREAGQRPRDAEAGAALLSTLVVAAARHEAAGGDRRAVRRRLHAAVEGLVER